MCITNRSVFYRDLKLMRLEGDLDREQYSSLKFTSGLVAWVDIYLAAAIREKLGNQRIGE